MIGRIFLFEFLSTVRRRSFVLITLGMPFFVLSYGLVITLLSAPAVTGVEKELERPLAIVDCSGILVRPGGVLHGRHAGAPFRYENARYEWNLKKRRELDYELPPGLALEKSGRDVILFENMASARTALLVGRVQSVVRVPEGVLEEGELEYYVSKKGMLDFSQGFPVQQLLTQSLLSAVSEPALARRLSLGFFIRTFELDPKGEFGELRQGKSPLGIASPLALAFLLIIVLMMNASFFVAAVAEEKQTRLLEVLLTSVDARALLVGKVLGLTASGTVQIFTWVFFLAIGPRLGRMLLGWDGVASFDVIRALLACCFAVAGLVFYGVVFAGVGATSRSPSAKRCLSAAALLAAGLPLVLSFSFIVEPAGIVSRILSYIPLFSPASMILRIALSEELPWLDIVFVSLCLLLCVRMLSGLSANLLKRGAVG